MKIAAYSLKGTSTSWWQKACEQNGKIKQFSSFKIYIWLTTAMCGAILSYMKQPVNIIFNNLYKHFKKSFMERIEQVMSPTTIQGKTLIFNQLTH